MKISDIGAVNDANYVVFKEGKHCKVYRTWVNMLERAYCPKYHSKYPTYKDVKVCKEWLLFSNFRKWYLSQETEGVLDKDVRGDGKTYSPDHCIILHPYLNRVFSVKPKSSGLPTGVEKSGKKYRARLNKESKYLSLGTFNTEKEAKEVFLKAKYEYVEQLIEKYESREDIKSLMRKFMKQQWK